MIQITQAQLATESRCSVATACQDTSIKSDTGAAATITSHRLVGKSVRIVTAALAGWVTSIRVVLAVIDNAVRFLVKTIRVLKTVRDSVTSHKQIKHLDHKDTFDFTGMLCAAVAVKRVAGLNQASFATAGTRNVKHLPGHTGIVSSFINDVNNGTVIAHGELSTEAVEAVDRFGVPAPVVLHKVAPAAVLVDIVEIGAKDFGNVPVLDIA